MVSRRRTGPRQRGIVGFPPYAWAVAAILLLSARPAPSVDGMGVSLRPDLVIEWFRHGMVAFGANILMLVAPIRGLRGACRGRVCAPRSPCFSAPA